MVHRLAKPMVDAALAKRDAPPPSPSAPSPEALQLREHIRDAAFACNVKPKAVRHVVRDAESIFELKDGAVVAKDNARQPANPLQPVTLVSWLADLHEAEPFLFEP